MTVTGAPVSVVMRMFFATTALAVGIMSIYFKPNRRYASPVPLYKSRIATSFPVAPGTSYLTRGVIQLTQLEWANDLEYSPAGIAHASSFVVFRVTIGLMLSKSHNGQESNPLIDGTSEILKCEGVDEGVVRRRGIWFRARLEYRTRSWMSINIGENNTVLPDPSSWRIDGWVSSRFKYRRDVLLSDEDLHGEG